MTLAVVVVPVIRRVTRVALEVRVAAGALPRVRARQIAGEAAEDAQALGARVREAILLQERLLSRAPQVAAPLGLARVGALPKGKVVVGEETAKALGSGVLLARDCRRFATATLGRYDTADGRANSTSNISNAGADTSADAQADFLSNAGAHVCAHA